MSQQKYIFFVVCLTLLPLINSESDNLTRHIKYVIVIDGDYQRTSVNTFFFESNQGEKLKFMRLYQEEVTPGLPGYFDNPEKCIPGLKKLMANAQAMVPIPERSSTPLYLIGRTGFRYYPDNPWADMSKIILEYFKTTGLQVGNDSVSLMEGRKKVFQWLSINLNLDRLESNKTDTVTTINLGGRYTDVALVPEDDDRMPLWRWKFVANLTAFDRHFEVYSYSYYGLGYNEVRLKVFQQGYKPETGVYVSECLSSETSQTWTFKDKEYKIRGAKHKKKSVSKKACLQRIHKVLDKFERGASLEGKEIFGTTHFYQVALDSGMVERGLAVNVTVDDFFEKARHVCKDTQKSKPFLCMDLLYINSFLSRIYSLTNHTVIRLATRLNGHDIDWPLGAAFEAYQEDINGIGNLIQKPKFS